LSPLRLIVGAIYDAPLEFRLFGSVYEDGTPRSGERL